jgi:hypothetical protein
VKYRGPYSAPDAPKPPPYVTRDALNQFSKSLGEAMGDQLRVLSDRIEQLEAEVALVRAVSRKEDA